MPNILEIDIQTFFAIFCLTLAINFLLFRKLMFNLVDPIWFFVIINTCVTLTLVIYDRFIDNDFWTILYVILCQLLFIFCAHFTKWIVVRNQKYITQPRGSKETIDSRSAIWLLRVSTLILSFVFVYYVVSGLPALSNDPELARTLARRDGGGAITRLFNVFTYLSLTLWFYISLKKIRIDWISSSLGISLPIFLLLSVGSKASVIFIYISFFYVSYYLAFEAGRSFRPSVKYFFITATSIIGISFLLIYTRAEAVGTTTSSMEFAGMQLLQRIIFAGIGAFHYFATNIPGLNNLNIFDYIYQYLILPLFGPMRILPYEQTIGSILAISMSGDDTFGPNPSMFVEGNIYFGRIAGVLYCGVLGIIFSFFRYYALNLYRLPSFVRVIAFSFGCMLITTITYDMILFVGEVINSLILITPLLIGVMFANESVGSRTAPKTVDK